MVWSMSGDAFQVANLRVADQLRGLFGGIDASARANLLLTFEKSRLNGEAMPGAEFIIEELRQSLRGKGYEGGSRLYDARRLFFDPANPFLISESTNEFTPGRIRRGSLMNIWQWLHRDLMSEDFTAYERSTMPLLVSGKVEQARSLTKELYTKVCKNVDDVLAVGAKTNHGMQRFTAQIGGPKVLEDLRSFCKVLKNRDVLKALMIKLGPDKITLHGDSLMETRHKVETIHKKAPDALPFALVLIMSRLVQPAQLVRILVHEGETDSATKLSTHPWSIMIDVVLGELERYIRRCAVAFRKQDHQAAMVAIREFHATARTLNSEIDLGGSNRWNKTMASLRSEMSRVVAREIELLPKHIKDLMGTSAFADHVNSDDAKLLEAELEMLEVARACASEIALNEMAIRIHNDARSLIDTCTNGLLEKIKAAQVPPALIAEHVELAVRISSRVFGSGYAQLFQKAAELALQEPYRRQMA